METQNYETDPFAPKKSNTGLIIAIVAIVLLCCCCMMGIGGWFLYQNGDALIGTSLILGTA